MLIDYLNASWDKKYLWNKLSILYRKHKICLKILFCFILFSFQELHRTNRQMQARLVDLLDKVANEEVTSK